MHENNLSNFNYIIQKALQVFIDINPEKKGMIQRYKVFLLFDQFLI